MLSIPILYVHGFNIGFGVGLELSEASQHITHECYVVVAHSDELLFFCEDVLSPFFFLPISCCHIHLTAYFMPHKTYHPCFNLKKTAQMALLEQVAQIVRNMFHEDSPLTMVFVLYKVYILSPKPNPCRKHYAFSHFQKNLI